jgi:glycolate oxidase iron-sulfur subunit
VRLLVIAGCEVVVPRAQSCCGALHAHAGLRDEAKALARINARAFTPTATMAEMDFIVTDSAGCGAALREMGHLLHGDAAAEPAARFAGKVRDLSEVLAEVGLPPAPAPLHSARDTTRPLRVAYHDPCHLAHAQRVRTAPRALLAKLAGVDLVDLPNSDWCCGSAGIYNLTHPDMAGAQLEHKLDSIAAVAPELVVASNPGCMLHMQRGVNARGLEVRVVHIADVLALAYPARVPSHA